MTQGMGPLQANGVPNNFSARLKFSKRRTGQSMCYMKRTILVALHITRIERSHDFDVVFMSLE